MIRRVIATIAMGSTLALGGAGVASAATSGPSTSTAHQVNCANAAKRIARIDKLEARGQKFVTNAQSREAAAQKAGKAKLAKTIANRISLVQKLEKLGTKRLQRIEAACPGSTATPSAATTSA